MFADPAAAVAAAIDAQRALGAEAGPESSGLRVRMGLHVGAVTVQDGDYFGTEVNRTARLMSIAHGGQIVCSRPVRDLVGDGFTLTDLGEHRLRDLSSSGTSSRSRRRGWRRTSRRCTPSEVSVVATSREGLAVAGERIVAVPVLEVPVADTGAETIMAAGAVRLFADRATAAKHAFALDERNAAAVGTLCRRLEAVSPPRKGRHRPGSIWPGRRATAAAWPTRSSC